MTQLRVLLANRNFLTVWSSSVVSGFGDKIAVIALYVLVYNLSGRAVNLGLLAAVQIVPAIVLGPLAGLILDRFNRKTVMVWADLVSAVVVALLPFTQNLLQVYIIAGLLAAGRQFTGPARLAIVPDIVPDEHLDKANALSMVTRNIVMMVGPAAGAALVALGGTSLAFWADSLTFLVSATLLLRHRFEYLPRTESASEAGEAAAVAGESSLKRAWLDIRRGVNLVWQHPRLRFAFYFMGAVVFVTAMQTPLLVFFVKTVLARGDLGLGLMLSATGVGGILGALAVGVLRKVRHPLHTVAALMAVDGLLLILFALNRSYPWALLLVVLFGAISTMAQISLATFLQRETPGSSRGRVFGWLGTIIAPLSLVSVFAGSMLAEVVGVILVLALSGLFEIGVGLLGWLRLTRSETVLVQSEQPRKMAGEA